jgi:aldehyde:ferredoxin oxidoreductase
VYTKKLLAECLKSVGYETLAQSIDPVSRRIQELRWQIRSRTGFDPRSVSIPKRFTEIKTRKGPIDKEFLDALLRGYSDRISEMAKSTEDLS